MRCGLFEARGTRNIANSGSKGFEDRVEALDGFFGASNHHAVAAINSPDAAAGSDVDVVHAFGSADFGAADVIFEERVATVNDGVASLHLASKA